MPSLTAARVGLAAGALLAPLLGVCAHADAQERVDVELVLAVDVSLSMSPEELEIQRHGYVSALTSDEVVKAIQEGAYGRIAVSYFEWAGEDSQKVVVPWTIIASAEDARRVADQLTAEAPGSARRTSISSAIRYAVDLFAESGFRGTKRVIDISGDGPNNQGPPVLEARDAALSQGITINGLPLMTNGGLTSSFSIEDLDEYYSNCVIGGPGAFMVPVNDWPQFPETLRRKLVLELADSQPRRAHIMKAAAPADYDCMIGEKMWNNRSWMWRSP